MKFPSKMISTPGSTESFLNQTRDSLPLERCKPLLLESYAFVHFLCGLIKIAVLQIVLHSLENERPEVVTNQDLESVNRTIGALF